MSATALAVKRESAPALEKPGMATLAVFPPDKPGGQPTTALVKMTTAGLVRSALVRVGLSEEKGEVWFLGGFVNDKWDKKAKAAITASGYFKLNQFGGVSFATPETIVGEDGKASSNPYFHREHGEIIYVKVRRIGIGRNAIGNLVAIDLTVTYNIRDYFAQDVFAKWSGKKSDAATAGWGQIYDADNVPDDVRKDGRRKLVRCPGGVVLALDLSSKDAIACIQEHINRQKFAERNAWTICERNILKKFFAAAQLRPNDLTVPVVAWQTVDRDIGELARIAASSRDGRVSIGDEELELQRETQVAAGEDVDAALAGDADEDMPQPEPDGESEPVGIGVPVPPPPAKDGGASKQLDEARAKLRELYGKLPQPVADEILAAAQLPTGLGWIADADEPKLLAGLRALTIDTSALIAETKSIVGKLAATQISNREPLFLAVLGVEKAADAATLSAVQAVAALKLARQLETITPAKRPKTIDEWKSAIQDAREGWF